MRHLPLRETRVLAIDPSSRGFGFAIFEGPENLIDWGVKQVKGSKNRECLRRIERLMEYYQPEVIVVEDCTNRHSRRCLRVRELIGDILVLAAARKIKSRAVSRALVRKAFSSMGASTKQQIAAVIAEQFPELAPHLPPFRKLWMSEDYRMSIFDAGAFAAAHFYLTSSRRC
jgi:Holliday junction resolvasome RuvABC endonuclease subunit